MNPKQRAIPTNVDPVLGCCWPTVFDAGPTSTQHLVHIWWLLGCPGSGRSGADEIHWLIAGSMLGRRRRRLTNIEPALGQRIVFTGQELTRWVPLSMSHYGINHQVSLAIASVIPWAPGGGGPSRDPGSGIRSRWDSCQQNRD